jgi:putative ABC transport system permease protein
MTGKHGMSRQYSMRRTIGSASGGMLALVLLVCGCVFAAIAGPAISLHTRTQALHQTLAGLASTTTALSVSGAYGDFVTALLSDLALPGQNQLLSPATVPQSNAELRAGFKAVGVPLATGSWFGLNTNTFVLKGGGARANAGAPPKLEVAYRDVLTGNAQLVAGSYAGTAPRGMLPVAATTQTAYRFSLHVGSRLTVSVPGGQVGLFVTAIVRQRGPGSNFWTEDPTVAAPDLIKLGPADPPYWVGGLFADPGQFTAMQQLFSAPGMEMTWEFPLSLGGVGADQAPSLDNRLNQATSGSAPLTGALTAGASVLAVNSPLQPDLATFLGTQAAIQTVLLLLFVSLIITGAAVILLAARMIVLRRAAELAMLRARGGSVRQVAALMARAGAIAVVPAALIGAGLAVLLIPGDPASSSLGWALAAVTVLTALAGPPLIAAWQHRRPAPSANPARFTGAETGRPRVAWRRPVAEVTACAAAVAGLLVLHDQGLPAAGSTDLYLAATPVLVAIPVVLVMLRLYPLVLRGLLAASARGAGATGFVALSRAARSSLTGVLPAFGLVLALSLATFAGMVNGGVNRAETAASWQVTGADAIIRPGADSSAGVTSAMVRALAGVRGVRAVTAVWNTSWVSPDGQPVQVSAVEPGSYAALVAGTPFPAFPSHLGSVGAVGSVIPVIASPQAVALLGTKTAQLDSQASVGPIDVRVTGVVSGTPAQAGGGAFLVMPLQTLPGAGGIPAPNLVLVTGSAIDDAQLTAVANKMIPSDTITLRRTVLAALASSPLQHGALLIMVLTIAAAAAFGLFIVILGLALGSAERELTLARLEVMGHERSTRLVLTEAMPAVLAAVVAGGVCAVLLPHLIGSSIDLSAFTGIGVPVTFAPDLITLGLPAVVTCVVAAITLAADARALRRRGITGLLRAN